MEESSLHTFIENGALLRMCIALVKRSVVILQQGNANFILQERLQERNKPPEEKVVPDP